MPGTLPVLNKKAVEYSIKTGLAQKFFQPDFKWMAEFDMACLFEHRNFPERRSRNQDQRFAIFGLLENCAGAVRKIAAGTPVVID